MSSKDREELRKLIKARARLAGRMVDERARELLADAEQKLAAEYKFTDAAWSDLTAVARQVVKDADAELARRCTALGIPAAFRPQLSLQWYHRGENASRERRVELRKVAQTRIAALGASAKVAIEAKALDGLTLLTHGALASREARDFLASMPTVAALMPALDIATLGPLALAEPRTDEM